VPEGTALLPFLDLWVFVNTFIPGASQVMIWVVHQVATGEIDVGYVVPVHRDMLFF
jgi:hypothetical protein